MKVFSIRKWAFIGISLLILALPVSRHWRLFINGVKVPGTVDAYSPLMREHRNGEVTLEYASEIRFQAEGRTIEAHGPWNQEYKPGRIVNVIYGPQDPSDYCVLTFTGLYLNNYSILPLILLVLWGAFYLSLYNYANQVVKGRKSDIV